MRRGCEQYGCSLDDVVQTVMTRWTLGLAALALGIAACTGVDDASDETAADTSGAVAAAAPSTTTEQAAPPATTDAAASPATTEATSKVAGTEPGDEDTNETEVESEAATDTEPLPEQFAFDCGTHCLDENSGVVGVQLAPGLWQWSARSPDDCRFIAVSANPRRPDGSRVYIEGDLWWLDARSPVVLAERETVIGFAPEADETELVIATNPVKCILERVGTYDSDVDIYAQRHGVDDAQPGADVTRDEADWTCYAHVDPELATELNWSSASPGDHADVSCVVGEGITAGWWQWRAPGGNCAYLVTQDADDPDRHRLRRRDATEPLLLTAGESVWGYSESSDRFAPFTISTTVTDCVLQLVEPE